ncbi:APC family permease [Namhaeicola litoreus]|uniref:APC family permease n=1 Tax=Namhaeicola litoreus TaxID=1052145 RepID=A0ABW3Y103_9FLAO
MTTLKREFGKWDMVFLIINGIIGAGIFGLPAKIYALSGFWSLAAMVLCAAIIFCVVLVFAEVSSQFKNTGGPYLYVYQTLGPLFGFFVGWLLFISRIATYAALVNLLVTYLSFFSHVFEQTYVRILTIALVTFFLFLLNYRGVKNAKLASNLLTITKLSALFLFIAVGIFYIDKDLILRHREIPSISNLSSSILVLVFAFTGFEAILVNTGEVKNPKKTIPFALVVSIIIVATFYLLIQFVCMGTLPDLASSNKPLAEAAYEFSGVWGGSLISLGALFSILGTLHSIVLIGSRVPFAMSKKKQLPKMFGKLNPKTSTPNLSIIIFSVLVLLVSISNTFYYALGLSVITKVMIIFMTSLTLIKLRQKGFRDSHIFRVKGGVAFAIFVMLISLWLLSNSNTSEFISVMIALVVGVLIYFITDKISKKA